MHHLRLVCKRAKALLDSFDDRMVYERFHIEIRRLETCLHELVHEVEVVGTRMMSHMDGINVKSQILNDIF